VTQCFSLIYLPFISLLTLKILHCQPDLQLFVSALTLAITNMLIYNQIFILLSIFPTDPGSGPGQHHLGHHFHVQHPH
jgi:hypothetical protein